MVSLTKILKTPPSLVEAKGSGEEHIVPTFRAEEAKQKISSKQRLCPKNEGYISIRNVDWLSTDYREL
jgi:hypothetical protein